MPRVMVIAHGFPPAGGSGSNRALAFARYLPLHGWRPVVLTVGAAWATNRDDGLLAEVPRDVAVVRTRSLEPLAGLPSGGPVRAMARPSRLRQHLGHVRRFPDAHLGWLPFAVAAGLKQPSDMLYSSSGPFTSHLVGLLLHRLTRRPWVAELRDGWYQWNRAIFPDYPAWRGPLERRLEATVIRTASRVVLVTDRMANAFRAQYPDVDPRHFAVISNGFDPAQFSVTPPRPADGRFDVIHAGALYYGRSLASFLHSAIQLIETDPDFARAFRLVLVGSLDRAARSELESSGLGDRLEYRGQVDHAATLAALGAADLLLLVANTTPGAEATVPGKLFEYLAAGRPVLAIAPSAASSTGDVLQQTRAGWLAQADDPEQIACALHAAFRARPQAPNPAAVARFDRRVLAGDLARVFDDVRVAHRI
jgi:glycosyltransferase involved in cell wall biosynthesis